MTKEDKIRARRSYGYWKELFVFIQPRVKNKKYLEDIMFKFFGDLDNRNGYGSATNSYYARESLQLLLNDMR